MNGGVSRCFPFWQEVLACYVVNSSADNRQGANVCGPALDDYYECLHHKKEKIRVARLQAALRKAEATMPREEGPTVNEIRSLGMIGKEEVSKKILEASQQKKE